MGFKENLKVQDVCSKDCYKVYDKDKNYLGNIKAKDEKKLTDEYLCGVTCFVINEDNQVLMEVRANTELTPGKVDLVSGHVNGSETCTQAMIRELNEEVGITNIDGGNLKKINKLPKSLGFESNGKIRNFFIDFYCFKTKKEHFTLQPEEVKSIKWVDMNQAFDMIKNGKTKFPKQQDNVNYDEIFKEVERFGKSEEQKQR